jgi:hypothetical protein
VGININNQSASQVNNVDGDMYVIRSQLGVAGAVGDLSAARTAALELQHLYALASPTKSAEAELVVGQLEHVNAEMKKDDPDKPSIAEHLRRVIVPVLKAASVIDASKQVVNCIQLIVQWLGPAGTHLTSLIGAVV